MIGLLFVDDEADLLRGIKRALRSRRKEWHMHFAAGGAEALKIMEEHAIDLVVSDMRMPEMDGAQLLAEVAEKYPHTIRFILSGQSDPESTLRAVGVSHQFWAKPTDIDELSAMIDKVFVLRDMLKPEIWRIMNSLQACPSPEHVIRNLTSELKKSDADLEAVTNIVATDVSLSAKLVQLTNSAYFGTGNYILVPGEAVRLLGLDIIKSLMETDGFVRTVDQAAGAADIFQQSSIAADIGERVGLKIGMTEKDWSLARQVCKFFMISLLLEKSGKISGGNLDDGRYLAALWGFPDALLEFLSLEKILSAQEDLPVFAKSVLAMVFPEFAECCDLEDPTLVLFTREIERARTEGLEG